VLVDMAAIGTATVAADGTWTFTVPTALGDGPHRIDVIATDLAGNVADSTAPSMGAAPVTFTVRTRTVVDITAPIGTTRDTTPDVTGTGDAGATIAITLTGPMGMMFTGTATVTAAGTWSFAAPMLIEGSWTTSVIATDALGNTATDTQPFIVDGSTTVDFRQPVEGSTTGDTTPELSGTGEPGASIAIQIDGMMVGTVLVDAEGNWTFQVATALTDGPHTVRVTATDAAGNTATDMGTFNVDGSIPALEIRAPGDNTTTSDTTPTISGTTEPGLTVTVTLDGAVLGTVVAGADGSWELAVTTPLAAGPHTVLATTIDAGGNMARDQHAFTVDTDAPSIDIVRPIDGSTIRDNTPTIRGTTDPNTEVEVFVDGALVGTVTSDATGAWTLDVTTPLADGAHTMRAVATDDAGNTATDMGGFTIDRAARVDFMQPGSDGPIGDTTPELSGTGDPDGRVVVTLDGMVIGTVTVDAEGNWTLQVPTALADGPHMVSVTLTNEVGETATDTGSFVVNTMAPALEIRTPADNSTTADNTPTITGSSDPGALVAVYVDGALLGTTTTNVDGTWSIPVTMPLMGGVHTALATTTNAAGISVTDQHDFTVDTSAPAVDVTAPEGRIQNRMPALVGTSEAGAEVQVFLDGVLVGTVTVGADGAWSVPTTTMLADGEHTVRAVATDDVGNTATDSGAFVIDTATTVVIDRPADMAVIGSPRPTYLGTAEPGATVTVSIDGMPIGMVVVGADGRWTFAQPTDLTPGAHQITAASVDSVGNTATDTNSFTFDPAMLDSDGDGLLDTVECPMAGSCPDSDMDGMPDQLDPDDDGDGVPTAIECSTPGSCTDTDMDMRPDYLDPDDDGDGRPTRDERPGMISVDTDGDGRPDYLDTDDDGDGLLTSAECMAAPCRDTDMDMRPDYLDPDDDNDGILTARERTDGMRIGMGGDDVDMDGTPNWLDTNSDGDSVNDREEGLRDSDMDGRPDYLDPNFPAPRDDAGVRGDAGPVDAGPSSGADAGPIVGGLAGGACGCSAAGTQGTTRGLWLAMMALVAVVVRRRMKR
jgi:MYXO-CTERM domain-containing protein